MTLRTPSGGTDSARGLGVRLLAQIMFATLVAAVVLPVAVILLAWEIVWGWANGEQQDTGSPW